MAERVRTFARRWRAWTGTVRARTTGVAVLVVGVALLVGAAALVASLREVLTTEVRTAAEARADRAVTALDAGAAPTSVVITDDDDVVIQVLDADGDILAASSNAMGHPPIADLGPGDEAEITVPFDDDRFLAVSAPAGGQDGAYTVLFAHTLDSVSESVGAMTAALSLGLPLLLAVVGATTWWLVGRALAPVDAVRREVDAISASQLHRRVPEPGSSDEVARLTVTMNRMLDRLEQARDRQRRLVSDASHELRSPVAVIRQHAEVALAHPERMPTAALAETVAAEGLRLQQLVDDLLLLARADEGTLRLDRRPLDVDDVVFDEVRRLRASTVLHVDATAVSAGRALADAAATRRIVRNLVDNAANHARTRIGLSLTETDGQVVLHVDDDGLGIAAADRARVFDRFVRLDDARARDDGGAGLGLAIVTELVAAHGGDVAVADSPLGGARVTLRLPGAGEPAG
ncbi:MAG TPA: HAMP domain-containing sensor histidine kinase [Jiangellaceae bacterium]|nr:HAMP domain-containing sensor histidine kinase [Jiangellaceae bacterium]